jgi:hypothetical protein
MPGGNIGASAPSARPCVPSSRSCRYTSTTTLPIVAGGKGETRMGGEDCRHRQRLDDPNPPRGCGGNGPKGATTAGRDASAPPPHVNSSNDGSGGYGRVLCLLLSSLAAAAVRGQCHGDNGNNGDDNGNNSVHSDGGEHGGNGSGKGTPPQTPPLSLPTQLLVLACFVILCILLF